MQTTIDKAGRVVIPSLARERAGFLPGEAIEIVVEDDSSVRLVRRVAGPKLVRVGKRLRAKPTATRGAKRAIDVAALVEEERNRWPW